MKDHQDNGLAFSTRIPRADAGKHTRAASEQGQVVASPFGNVRDKAQESAPRYLNNPRPSIDGLARAESPGAHLTGGGFSNRSQSFSPLKLLDLFSGIGGFSLGLERSGLCETVAFCEIEEFPRRVLAKHWPEVPCYHDIRTLTADTLAGDGIAVDAICGGFPCQDLSHAGKRAGLDGQRSGLWSEYRRLIGEIRPKLVIVENVTGLLSLGLGDVLGDLAALGYDAVWHCIPASAVGAPHRRDRVWIVAYTKQVQRICAIFNQDDGTQAAWRNAAEWVQNGLRSEMGTEGRSVSSQWLDQPDPPRVDDGVSAWPHRLGALGNAVVPQIPELIGRAILRVLTEQALTSAQSFSLQSGDALSHKLASSFPSHSQIASSGVTP